MYLASRYDPRNEDYKRQAAEYEHKAKIDTARKLIQLAENAESYHNVQSANYHYQKACELDPPMGLPFYRLAQVMRLQDGDEREILRLLRTAVQKDPTQVGYRLGLAEFYVIQGLNANARREYQAVLEASPENPKALAGLKKAR
jgi:Tfp pilus assembly protein PilF